MVFKGAWFIKFKNCVHKIKLELNMKNKIGKRGIGTRRQIFFKEKRKKFGKNYRVRIHTER